MNLSSHWDDGRLSLLICRIERVGYCESKILVEINVYYNFNALLKIPADGTNPVDLGKQTMTYLLLKLAILMQTGLLTTKSIENVDKKVIRNPFPNESLRIPT